MLSSEKNRPVTTGQPLHESTPVAAGLGTPPNLSSVRALSPARRAWVENISLLLNHKWLIIITTVIVTAITGVIAFQQPNWFKSSTVILPSRKASGGLLDNIASSLGSTIKDLGVTKIGGGSEGSYSPLALASSRELHEKLIKNFGLMKVYQAKTMAEALQEFDDHFGVELSEEGNFVISFEDTNKKLAADVANATVGELNDIGTRLAMEEAKQSLSFIEKRYQRNVVDLDSAEKSLNEFQKRFGVYALPDQAKAQVAALSTLEQQKYAAEIQLQNAEQLYGTQAAETQMFRNTVRELGSKLNGLSAGLDADASSYFVPMKMLPELAIQYVRLMREVEIQSKLKAFILPSYEQAKLDVQKNILAFVVLDHAVPADKKSKPRRSLQLLLAMVSSVIVTSLGVLAITHGMRIKQRFAQDRSALSTQV